ncbi:cytochrome P450 76T24-like [Juglans microcarpa x Juglans regia]|uniref:cytochrome P450 76T24-like n=1 Tax=Juglans microcarpa x Juglans regia TaxID=2249226 RepID=UPI001B7E1C8E|nr:cytochrome P450 76T24-like [Juglans microcarpa x Juglans regia]
MNSFPFMHAATPILHTFGLMDYIALLLLISFVSASIHVLASGLGGRKKKSGCLTSFPPGPKAFPFVGNISCLQELRSKPHQTLAKLSKQYGPLMTLKLGSTTTVVISSPDTAKEALQKHDQAFSSRTIPDAARASGHHKFSVAWLPASTRWRSLRKVAAMEMFVPQRLDATEAIRHKKVQELIAHIGASCNSGEAIDIGGVAFTTVFNVISNMLFSTDLAQYGSNTSQEFQALIMGAMEEGGRPNIADYFPALRLFDPQGARRRLTAYIAKLFGILDGIINERLQLRATSNASKAGSDVLDSLLSLVEDDNSELSYDDVKHLLMDLYSAGSDTKSSAVEWAMAELLHNPSKMAKVREELEEVIGKDGLVQESDISKLPYLLATVKETFRLHPPAPLLLPHKAEVDVEMRGFTVPKNAQILVNVWGMGRDSSIWPNPDQFSPERFLDKDIDYKGRNFELIPFGAGRRICPGLPLANRMVPLMLASLLHHFNWKLEDEMKPEDMDMRETTFGITLRIAQPLRAIPIKSL